MAKVKFTEETPTRPEHLAKRVKTNGTYLTKDGAERPDPTPMAPPIGHRPSDPLHLKIRQMILSEKLRLEAEAAGMETLDEADDFDVGDDYDPNSPYEEIFDPIGFDPGAARAAVDAHNQAVESARNAPRGSAEPVATQAPAPSSAPSNQQPTGAGAEGAGQQGVPPGPPPAAPNPERQPPRSPFWPRR